MLQSAKKTRRIIIAHEAPRTAGFGAEIAAALQVSDLKFTLFPNHIIYFATTIKMESFNS